LYPEDAAIRFLQTIGSCHTIWYFFPQNIEVFISVKLQHCVVYAFHFVYLETYMVGKWGETKEEGGAQAVFASLSRQIPSPPCPHFMNTFQVSRYGNRTVELWFMTRRMTWAQHIAGSWKDNMKMDLRKICYKFHVVLSICCSGKALEWSIR
jgi:hypothetical protein